MNEHTPHNPKDKPTNIIDKIDHALDTRFPGYDERLAAKVKKFGKNILPAVLGAAVFTGAGIAINEAGPRTPLQTGTIEYVIPQGDPAYQQNTIRNTLVDEAMKLAQQANVPIADVKGASGQAKDIYNNGDVSTSGGIVVTLEKKPLFGYDITAQRYDLNHPANLSPLEQSEK